jgi:CBS domain-containing protein
LLFANQPMDEEAMKKAATAVRTWAELSAAEVMKSPVIAVNESTPLADAAETLSEYRISGAVVNDHRGVPVGVVSLLDIAAALAGLDRPEGELSGFYRAGRFRPEPEEGEAETAEEGPTEGTTVRDIMSPEILSVPAAETLDRVASTLHRKQIHRVFVRDEKGVVVGVVSTMDLLRALTGKLRE